MQEELRQHVEAMKEKDGAISILRSRLQTVRNLNRSLKDSFCLEAEATCRSFVQ